MQKSLFVLVGGFALIAGCDDAFVASGSGGGTAAGGTADQGGSVSTTSNVGGSATGGSNVGGSSVGGTSAGGAPNGGGSSAMVWPDSQWEYCLSGTMPSDDADCAQAKRTQDSHVINPGTNFAVMGAEVVEVNTGFQFAPTDGPTMAHTDAEPYCDAYQGGGFTDWRLPNVFELAAVLDFGRDNSVGTSALALSESRYFISFPGVSLAVWINIATGDLGANGTATAGIRCVRGTPFRPTYTQVSGMIYREEHTGLEYDFTIRGASTWGDALDACPLGFRLPSVKEGLLLVDAEPLLGDRDLWTSTPLRTSSDEAYSFNTGFGHHNPQSVNVPREFVCISTSRDAL